MSQKIINAIKHNILLENLTIEQNYESYFINIWNKDLLDFAMESKFLTSKIMQKNIIFILKKENI